MLEKEQRHNEIALPASIYQIHCDINLQDGPLLQFSFVDVWFVLITKCLTVVCVDCVVVDGLLGG